MHWYVGFIVLAVSAALVHGSSHANLEEATCPPARFIVCGSPPTTDICPGMVATCCWVVYEDGTTVNENWGVADIAIDTSTIEPQNLGIPDGSAIMTAEFDIVTRAMVALRCNYRMTDKCIGGSLTDNAPVFVLVSRDPSRYRVTEDVAAHIIRETVPNPDEYVCDCSNKDTLPFPERYRCCYWASGLGGVKETRTWTCSAPPATTNPTAPDCHRIIRGVTQCGDAGGCYCRFEYVPLASFATREPWDCGKCCPALTGVFGRDLVEKHNNTRANCLDPSLAFRLPGDNACEDRGLFRSGRTVQSNAARVTTTLAAVAIAFCIPALWNY